MANWINVILMVLCAVMLGVLLHVRSENRRLTAEVQTVAGTVADLRKRNDEATAKTHALVQEVQSLQTRFGPRVPGPGAKAGLGKTGTALAVSSTDAKSAAGKPGPGGDKGAGFMGGLAAMMEKPEMRDAMRAQQKLMLDMLYGPLFKSLHLTPEAQEKLKDLLVDRQMAGMKLMAPGDQQAKVAAFTDTQKQLDQAVKELLGEEQYAVYEDYQATVGERMALNQFNQMLTGKGMAIDDLQVEKLVTLMLEERGKLNIPSAREQQVEWAGGMPSSEALAKNLERQEELNKRVYERSRELLSEAQQAELKKFQESQVQMQKLGMQMMKSMMGGEKKE